MAKRNEHSIEGEPFYQYAPPRSPDSVADEPACRETPRVTREEERALHNVWDEPALRAGGAAPPPEAVTYSRWYEKRLRESAWWQSWGTVVLLALCGGPFAIAGTVATQFTQGSMAGPLLLVAVGPALEEMMKIGALLIVLENRPYLFRSGVQVMLAAMAAALAFAVVENLLYIHFYYPAGSERFRVWRWTVCTAMHVGTTTVAGMGVLRMWRQAVSPRDTGNGFEFQRPQPVQAYPYIVLAVVIHGVYNGLAILMEFTQGSF